MKTQQTTSFEAGYEPVVAVLQDGEPVAWIGWRQGVTRLELPGDHAIHFDDAGRLISVQSGGATYRRALDNRILVSRIQRIDATRQGWVREIPPADPLDYLQKRHGEAATLLSMIEEGVELRVVRAAVEDPREWAKQKLSTAASFDREALRKDAETLSDLYLPIPILPPDQYGSLVLQATEGCSYNACGFCSFYNQTPYRERRSEEFAQHVDGVIGHLGASLNRIHRVFLGQANALLMETKQLEDRLAAVTHHLPLLPPELRGDARRRWIESHKRWIEGFYSFIDDFHGFKSIGDFKTLHRAGMRRVYLGLESGSDEILKLLRKPPEAKAAIELAERLRKADIAMGVVVLVGAGGRRHADLHERETLRILEAMKLRRGDQVYLSRLIIHEGSPYAQRVAAEGLEPLDRHEQNAQIERLRRHIREVMKAPVPVAPYDIDMSKSWLPVALG